MVGNAMFTCDNKDLRTHILPLVTEPRLPSRSKVYHILRTQARYLTKQSGVNVWTPSNQILTFSRSAISPQYTPRVCLNLCPLLLGMEVISCIHLSVQIKASLSTTFHSQSLFHAPATLLIAANTSNPSLEGVVYLKEAVDGTDCSARL